MGPKSLEFLFYSVMQEKPGKSFLKSGENPEGSPSSIMPNLCKQMKHWLGCHSGLCIGSS